MTAAQQFMESLQNQNIDEAINSIKQDLRERSIEKIQESRRDVLSQYGFTPSQENDT